MWTGNVNVVRQSPLHGKISETSEKASRYRFSGAVGMVKSADIGHSSHAEAL